MPAWPASSASYWASQRRTAIDQVQIAAHLANAQMLGADHVHHLQFEGGIEGSTAKRCHGVLRPRWG